MTTHYDLQKIRNLLNDGFTSEDLRRFAFDHIEFRPVYDNWSQTTGKSEIINQLLEHGERHLHLHILLEWAQLKNPAQFQKHQPYEITAVSPSAPATTPVAHTKTGKLCERITKAAPLQKGLTNWQFLEQVAIRAATAGGVAAMGYYRQSALQPSGPGPESKNPSTEADLQATARILETINSLLPPIVRPNHLDCKLSYLGEETKFVTWFDENIKGDIPERVLPAQKFFSKACENDRIRVIIDGIDGTGSFTRGLPLFCAAVAILIDDEARVSAVYDPIHHVVYSATLSGPYGRAQAQAEAWAWQVSSGSRVNLVALANQAPKVPLRKEALGFHLTRTNKQKLHAFLKTPSGEAQSMLERLAHASGAMYALNSGVVAMAEVARGALGGFVNNVTNHWDVAAGEVLVHACGGKVTDFSGASVTYSCPEQVSIVAAKAHLHDHILQTINP